MKSITMIATVVASLMLVCPNANSSEVPIEFEIDYLEAFGDSSTLSRFPTSIAVDNNVLVVGDAGGDQRNGVGYVYRQTDGVWLEESYLNPDGPGVNAEEMAGESVDISGDWIVLAAPNWNADRGGAHGACIMYRFDGNDWIEHSIVTAPTIEVESKFGSAVAIDGDRLVVGAQYANPDGDGAREGRIFVYELNNDQWQHAATLDAPYDLDIWGLVGREVALDGDYILAGMPDDDTNAGDKSGGAVIYEYSEGSWDIHSILYEPIPQAFSYFGGSIAVDGEMALISAREANLDSYERAGACYAYKLTGNEWTLVDTLHSPDPYNNEYFGVDVAISDGVVLVASPGTYGIGSGAAFIFREQDDGLWACTVKCKRSDPFAPHAFGNLVACDGSFVFVGPTASSPGGYLYVYSASPADCNENGIPDYDEIEDGALDENPQDGILDICQGVPTGACCIEGQCVSTTNDDCFNAEGIFGGVGSACATADCPTSCLGDLNNDGEVSVVDLLTIIDRWGFCP